MCIEIIVSNINVERIPEIVIYQATTNQDEVLTSRYNCHGIQLHLDYRSYFDIDNFEEGPYGYKEIEVLSSQ